MLGIALKVDDLTLPLSFDGGVDIEFKQQSPVTVTCMVEGGIVERVHADEGVTFQSDGGFVTVDFKPCSEITFLCSKREWQKKLDKAADDNDAMLVHTKGA